MYNITIYLSQFIIHNLVYKSRKYTIQKYKIHYKEVARTFELFTDVRLHEGVRDKYNNSKIHYS